MQKRKAKKFRISITIVALIEILTLIAVTTFSWIEGGRQTKIKSPDITITTGSDLTMYYDGKAHNSVVIPSCTLEETSSADGRNFFFPLAENKTNTTANMVFREGTAEDKNQKYVSIDFDLVAGDSPADVYFGSGTIINTENDYVMQALRMSFLTNDNNDPLVFSPIQMPGMEENYSPITTITAAGEPTTNETATKSYGDYYYKGKNSPALFHLNKDETKHITLVLWLEGTEFDSSEVASKDLSIYIEFTTNTTDLVKYNFIDNTHDQKDCLPKNWISENQDNYTTMMYIYDTEASSNTNQYHVMFKSEHYNNDHTWTAYVPKSIKKFTFRRYSNSVKTWWNQWEPRMGSNILTDSNGEHTYVAICGNMVTNEGENLWGAYGYWKDSNGTYRIYFQDSSSNSQGTDNKNSFGDKITCYTYTSKDGEKGEKTHTMIYAGIRENHYYYYVNLKESEKIEAVKFAGNYGRPKSSVYGGFTPFNGAMYWYEWANNDKNTSSGQFIYSEENYSLIYPMKTYKPNDTAYN